MNYDQAPNNTGSFDQTANGTRNFDQTANSTRNFDQTANGTRNFDQMPKNTMNYDQMPKNTANYDQQYINDYLADASIPTGQGNNAPTQMNIPPAQNNIATAQGGIAPTQRNSVQMEIPALPTVGGQAQAQTQVQAQGQVPAAAPPAPLSNKQLYLLNMNNNPHAMSDPAIQETLSPYFQPFGVDVAHLPMTNPPIFQSALPVYDEPVPRRRISISNGQISQLGEDIETVENLYNTQPPPLPRYHEPPQSYTENTSAPQPQWHGDGTQPQPQSQAPQAPQFTQPFFQPQQPLVKQEPLTASSQLDRMPRHSYSAGGVPVSGSAATHYPNTQGQGQGQGGQSSRAPRREEEHQSQQSQQSSRSGEPQPGTTAWKRARLLERNRIAASKCRQRKKVAQMQLQVDYNKIARDNAVLRRKIVYYEKLISKFKKFMESHFNVCHKSSNSVNDEDKNGLKMIQEMLMIDEDVHEVNDNGKILKISVKEPSPDLGLASPTATSDSAGVLDTGSLDEEALQDEL